MRTKLTAVAMWAFALTLCVAALPAPAQSTWTDGGGDNDWDNAANWSGGVPASMADVIFGTGGSTASMNNDGCNVGAVTFNRVGGFQILSNLNYGNPYGWTREFSIYGGVSVTAAETYQISARKYRVMLLADQTIDVASGGKLIFNTAPTGTYYSGCFKGYTVTKTGAGELEFTTGGAAYEYNPNLGSLNIQGGTVLVTTTSMSSMGGLSGTGTLVATSGVVMDQAVDGVFQGYLDMSTAGGYFKDGTGTLTISGANGRMISGGEIALRAGTLELDNSTVNRNNRMAGGMISLNGGLLKLVGNDTVGMLEDTGGATLAVWGGAGELNINHGASASATVSFGGVGHDDGSPIGAHGMLIFTGADIGASGTAPSSHVMLSSVPLNDSIVGWWRLGDEFASYDAAVGVLALAADHASRTGDLATATEADNVLATSAQSLSGNVTANSLKIQGGHGIDLGGYTLTLDTGGLIQTGSANSTGIHSGSLAATGNQLYVQAATDLNIGASVSGITLTKMGTGKLTLGDVSLSQGVVLCEGGVDITNNAAMKLIVNNAGRAGDVSKGGSGILTVSGGTLIGDVYVNSGTVQFGGGSVFGPTSTVHVIGSGVLQSTAGATYNAAPAGWASLEGGGRYVFHSAADGGYMGNLKLTVVDDGEIYNPGTDERHVDNLSGAGRLIKFGANPMCFDNGSANLSGFTGTLDVAEGTFRVSVGKRPKNAAGFHVRSGATLHWDNAVYALDNGYVFSGEGTILVSGGATPTLNDKACTFSPGASVGTLAITGGLSLGNSAGVKSVLDMEVADDAGSNDVLAVTGAVSGLDNTEVVFNLPVPSKAKFDINAGINVTFLTTSSVSGSFSAVSMSTAMDPAVAAHYLVVPGDIDTSSGIAAALVLTGTCWTAHNGDANLDDAVGIMDLVRVANNFGRSDVNVTYLTGDLNLSGDVSVMDLVKIANNYGWSSGGAGGGEAVPEPLTLAVLALGAAGIIGRRRRR